MSCKTLPKVSLPASGDAHRESVLLVPYRWLASQVWASDQCFRYIQAAPYRDSEFSSVWCPDRDWGMEVAKENNSPMGPCGAAHQLPTWHASPEPLRLALLWGSRLRSYVSGKEVRDFRLLPRCPSYIHSTPNVCCVAFSQTTLSFSVTSALVVALTIFHLDHINCFF